MKILVTGAAGFIGMHLSKKLLESNTVIGIDNINKYYDPKLKKHRIDILKKNKNFFFYKCDLINQKKIDQIFKKHKPQIVFNLAAQAGVRYSIEYPEKYIEANIVGFHNILKLSVKNSAEHIIFASTSSAYGLNKSVLNKETDPTKSPISVYAATKITNENLAHVYSYLYKIKTTGIRFFTVYGPLGRPDMALFKFVKNILKNKSIDVYNRGNMRRSFTYIDDVVEALIKLIYVKNFHDKKIPFDVLNIGNNKSVSLKKFINIIEKNLKKKSIQNKLPMQKGDVKATKADIKKLFSITKFKPKINIETGISRFIKWYLSYYKD